MWVKFTGAGEPMKHLAGATQILLWRRRDNFAVIGFTSTVTDDGRDHGRNENFDLWQAIKPPFDMPAATLTAGDLEYLDSLQRRGRQIDHQIAVLKAESEEVVNQIRDIRVKKQVSGALADYARQREEAGGNIHPADL